MASYVDHLGLHVNHLFEVNHRGLACLELDLFILDRLFDTFQLILEGDWRHLVAILQEIDGNWTGVHESQMAQVLLLVFNIQCLNLLGEVV